MSRLWPAMPGTGKLSIVSLVIVGLALLVAVAFTASAFRSNESGPEALGTVTTVASTTITPSIDTTTGTTSPASVPTTIRQPVVHVSPAGDDANDGQTSQSPVQSIDRALELARPGDEILFGPGVYPPITVSNVDDLRLAALDSSSETLFTADSYDVGPGIHIVDSTNVEVANLSVSRVLWGVKVEGSSGVLIDGMTVFDVGQEGIMVRTESNDVTVSNNTIFDTGNRPGGNDEFPFTTFGEGVYLGTGGVKADGNVDTTFDIRVLNNRIYDTTAEAIDIKPSVSEVLVADNVIWDVSTATSGAVVVGIGTRLSPDPEVVIERNVIFDISRTSRFLDGNAITVSAPAIVRANVIWSTQHYGILVDKNVSSSDGGVVLIENNLIASTGLDPVSVAEIVPGVDVTVRDNVLGPVIEIHFDPSMPGATDEAKAIARELDSGTYEFETAGP